MPHSLDDERGLLGSLLLAPADVCHFVARLPLTAWYGTTGESNLSPHAIIAKLALEMHGADTPLDLLTLTRALREAGRLEAVGGPAYLTSLIDFTPTAANASYYADNVRHLATLRAIHAKASAVAASALLHGADPAQLSEQMQQLLSELARQASTGSDVASMRELLPDAIARLEERHAGRGKLRGIASGFGLLDRLTGGWQAGQMIVVAAREKQGKSSLARQFALEAAARDVPVAIFSHEMGREEIVDAMIATKARVDSRRLEDGTLGNEEFSQITEAATRLRDAPIYVFDEADSSVLQFRANARRAVSEYNCRLIVLDYIQLVHGTGNEDKRHEAVANVSRNVKLAAKELGIPIIVLSQLNKEGDTRESMAIQQDLDRLIVIEHEKPDAEGDSPAWIKVKLSRGGPKGSVPVMWRPAITRFDPLAPDDAPTRLKDL